MIPLSDGIKTRRFPFVNVALIVAKFAVWIFYELPHLNSSVAHASFYPCAVNGSCHSPEPWPVSWLTAMFMHGSWSHILGNMLFLAIFGKNVEDAFGHLRYLGLYLAGGFVATMTQTLMTLVAGTGAAPGNERRAGGRPSRDLDAPPPDRTGTHRPGHRRDVVARLPERPRGRAHARGQPGRTG